MPLTAAQAALVKASVPVLRQHGETITTVFYQRLLAAHPTLSAIFSLRKQASGAQRSALAGAVLAYAAHIDDPAAALAPTIRHIAHRHVSLFVQPAQYRLVGEHLVAAFAHVLGDHVLTPDLAHAWTLAYAQLADVFIDVERQLYQAKLPPPLPAAAGDDADAEPQRWQDWRDFVIVRKEPVADDIVSFYLEPVADKHLGLPSFYPGQYVSVQIPVRDDDNNNGQARLIQSRQYSLSACPADSTHMYRITVKKPVKPVKSVKKSRSGQEEEEEGEEDPSIIGLVAYRLIDHYKVGDVVKLSPPCGDFTLKEEEEETCTADKTATEVNQQQQQPPSPTTGPIVLLSAGVGITPLLSMLDSLVKGGSGSGSNDNNSPPPSSSPPTSITWVHAARTSTSVPYIDHIRRLATSSSSSHTPSSSPPITAKFFLSSINSPQSDIPGFHHDIYPGRFDLSRLLADRVLPLPFHRPDARYFLCGPHAWMVDTRDRLLTHGVAPQNLHLELFSVGQI